VNEEHIGAVNEEHIGKVITTIVGLAAVVISALVVLGMWGCPKYNVYNQEMQGKAMYAHAEYSRKVQVAQAEGELEAATLRAKAIGIVGQAAKDFTEYRQQEFIGSFAEAMKEGKISQIIYVPTEANIPIIEAGKRK
jgi:hypothetical protein